MPVDRVDGPAKVTGAARYTAEIVLPDLAYATIVGATIPSGRIRRIDTGRALAAGGVLAVLTHEDLPRVAEPPHLLPSLVGAAAPGESFFPMQDDAVHYAGQPVAVVVADSLERAQHAASLVRVDYARTPAVTTLDEGRDSAYEPPTLFGGLMPARMSRGDVDAGLADADVRVDVSYHFAANHHNAIETSATTADWDGDRLTLYDSTMGIRATQLTVAHLLGLHVSDVRVVTHFVGGGFGSKAMTWPHVTLAAMAARQVGRPVRLALTRPQAFTSTGHREEQEQAMSLGAKRDGTLIALRHHKLSLASPFDDWAEPATATTTQVYACPNTEGVHRLVTGNTMTPTFTRGPGESVGVFVLETAMDQLAYELGVDPVELRLRCHAETDPRGNPWSSDGLAECLRVAASSFGWARRDPRPRMRREGDWLIGTGMAAAAYPVAFIMPTQRARARIYAGGDAVVQTGTQEFGTGVTTVMTQVAADGLGLPMEAVRFEAGDTDLPNTSAAVGSSGAMMVSAAVHNAATALRDQLVAMAVADSGSPLHGAEPSDVEVHDGRMRLRSRPEVGETYGEVMGRHHLEDAEALGSWTPPPPDTPHGLLTFGAQFAEVAVDPEFGLVRVRRLGGAFAPGRVLNPKTARSQLIGGMLWGMGQALLEGNRMDPRQGRWSATSLGDYLVPVNADAPDVTIDLIEVDDEVVGPLGAKGVGEIGQVGVAAAIANAVFHATGRRIRELPMTAELVMDPP
ncbi:xanthine dehydrogenase family protein molybdopterin-binding subunit [Phytohabitans sp. ZYX-F-186]|uniref:Xanthine dehydrogenase family protein molybdopterin-binding subunit n=1 Tax=Phytohabitans maris TaxID=3071409 RepID=A0ABU0ZE98_9ACTN|nr:xanthine dehydrogenase family protein molybdopterin-binding subunit [Phytohabitans sp. ZYX-F-186]MDQ7905384.1 xanthine dehydrogenase family protein molybdopterin-binding subunit [Phytohabitans sp. ZYX-F-186]